MSDQEIREELAGIVAGMRRVLARGGPADGELMLRAPRGIARPLADDESTRYEAIPEQVLVEASRATPSSERAAGERAAGERAAGERAATVAAPRVTATLSDRAATPVAGPAATELFERAPSKAFMFAAPPAIPPGPALNPIGAEARIAIAMASLPILQPLAREVCACTRCGLSGTRTQAVPGTGSAKSGIVFVGEAPGAEEDRQGVPFVGRAGELLTKIIKAMDDAQLIPGVPLTRETVYIANVLKCRPPENRNPLPHEIEACSPYMIRQLDALAPRIICCLGKFAAELLLGVKGTIAGMRGTTYRYRGSKLIVTYHPAACLRNPNYKRPVWEDMQLLAREYLAD